MTRNLRSIGKCLFRAFANWRFYDPQDDEQMWAIEEGVQRIDSVSYVWRSVKARKEHECIRGCRIKNGSIYFKRMIGAGWGSDWKFCAGCMAMILYFMEVDKMPPYWATHWDLEVERAVRVSE